MALNQGRISITESILDDLSFYFVFYISNLKTTYNTHTEMTSKITIILTYLHNT